MNDPTVLHWRRYNDGRRTVFVNGKEIGEPDYIVATEIWKRAATPIVTVRVTDARSGEVVAIYQESGEA